MIKIQSTNSSSAGVLVRNFFNRMIQSISDLYASICKSLRECCCCFKATKVVEKSPVQKKAAVIYQQTIPTSSPAPSTSPPPPTQPPPPPPSPPAAPPGGWYFLEKNDYIDRYVKDHMHEGFLAGLNCKRENFKDEFTPENIVNIFSLTFKDLQALSEEEQKQAIVKYQLAPYVTQIDQFYEKLKSGNPEILGQIHLNQLVLLQINPYENSVLKYALLSDQELGKLTPNDIKGIKGCQRDLVSYRVKGGKIDPNFKGDISSTPLVDFHKIPGKQLTEWLKAGNPHGVYFVTEDQLKEIDLNQIPQDYLHYLFIQNTFSAEESKKRFALLSPEMVNKLLLKLDATLLLRLSDDHLRKLDLIQIDPNQVGNIVNRIFGTNEGERFALLDQAQVQYIVPHIDGDKLMLLSNAHLAKLDLTQIPTGDLSSLVNRMFAYNHQERFAHLSQAQVQHIFPHIDAEKLRMLSNDHLSKLNLTHINTKDVGHLINRMFEYNHQERFAHLGQEQVQYIFPHLDGDKLRLLSKDHLSKLIFTQRDTKDVRWLINRMFDYKDGEHFAQLGQEQVQYIFPHLDRDKLRLLSKDHLSKLNFRQIDTKDVSHLINRMFDYKDGERFAQLGQAQVQYIFPHLDSEKLKLLSEDHLRNLDFTPVQKTEVHSLLNRMFNWNDRARFALLPAGQVQILLNEMDSAQLDLISDEQLAKLDLSAMQKPNLKKKLEEKKNK